MRLGATYCQATQYPLGESNFLKNHPEKHLIRTKAAQYAAHLMQTTLLSIPIYKS